MVQLITIVIPVFNEEQTLLTLHSAIANVAEDLNAKYVCYLSMMVLPILALASYPASILQTRASVSFG